MKNLSNFSARGFLTVPVAIVIAGLIIGVSVIYAIGARNVQPSLAADDDVPEDAGASAIDNVKPITDADHILGPKDALVKIIEFSDTECPFCKRFHLTMQDVVKEYDGKVAWAYRHFPLESLHSKAKKEAQATECAAELGGNEKFWEYTNRLYEVTPSNDGLDPAELANIAAYVGLDVAKFNACLASGKQAGKVDAMYQDAVASGGRGTPYSIVISPSGKKSTINGALPLASVKAIVDAALEE